LSGEALAGIRSGHDWIESHHGLRIGWSMIFAEDRLRFFAIML
jgi:hypothetical protein